MRIKVAIVLLGVCLTATGLSDLLGKNHKLHFKLAADQGTDLFQECTLPGGKYNFSKCGHICIYDFPRRNTDPNCGWVFTGDGKAEYHFCDNKLPM